MDALEFIRSKRGMMSRIADGLGLTLSTVSEWTRLPAERLPELEQITGIPRHALRPDICLSPEEIVAREKIRLREERKIEKREQREQVEQNEEV